MKQKVPFMELNEIKAKSALVKTNLPYDDFVVNPYSGCAFGCVYCYADFMRRFSGHLSDKWGQYVDIKINTPEIFKKDLVNLIKRIESKNSYKFKGGKKWPTIFFSSVTDPYQGLEAKYKLTRTCLEILADNKFQGEVSILTKSYLVTRDIDLFKKLKNVTVGLTITSTDDKIGRLFEKLAPPQSERLKALKKLNQAGIQTYAFVGPILPHFTADKQSLDRLFSAIGKTGTKNVFVEHINLTPLRMKRLLSELKGKLEKPIIDKFYKSQTADYKKELDEIINKLIKKYNLNILGGGIIEHSSE